MHLSRLKLNPRHRRVQSELARPYELHRSVLRAFPPQLPPDERVLYRLDADGRTGQLALFVQSQHAPDWRWVADFPGYLAPGAAPEVKEFALDKLQAGMELAFRLRANPTVKKKSHQDDCNPPKHGVRLGLAREEDQRAWLERKGRDHGFEIVRALIMPEGLQVGFGPADEDAAEKAQRRMAHLAVRYEGLLRVTDAERLRQAVCEGIGSAKGFGFGLLSLGPAHMAG